MLIGEDTEVFRCTAATITEDASDLSLELLMFLYIVGRSIMNMLIDVTPLRDWLLIVAAALSVESIARLRFALLTTSPPTPCLNAAPSTIIFPF